jgi:hypothetical protein
MAQKVPQQFKFELSPIQTAYANSSSMVNIIYSSRGEGKCLHPDTEIVMFDGSNKMIKDIIVGDQVMGDDSTPRNVLSVCDGIDDMYEVIPSNAKSFICNKEHILVLAIPTSYRISGMELEISVKNYLFRQKLLEDFCLVRNDPGTAKYIDFPAIKKIVSLGKGEYNGFTLDGNHRFLLSTSSIVSHNTFASVVAMLVHAQRNKKAIRCAIVRDTHENIKISVVRAIQEIFPRSLYDFKNDFKQLVIKSEPHVFCDLFGIDDLAALQKLQGPEYSLVWLEEPAPMSDKANAGLSEDVYNAALIVCARQKDTIARLQVSMNPADQDHWTYRRFLEEPDIDPRK